MNALLSKSCCGTYIRELKEIATGLAAGVKPIDIVCEDQQKHIFNCDDCHLYKKYIADTSSQGVYGRNFDTTALNLFLSSK